MEIVYLVIGMAAVGVFIGWVAGFIWKENRPLGVTGDYYISIATTIVVGLLDWYVIPAMGFNETLRIIGIATEPPLAALLVLWLVRKAKR